ncbi:FixH family protein [Marixanthomonas sp. SCSIO 43207]|uniref:FixH family protein n=1 Tax=Marixanthomonas sp. SCSIO 43207 TaxID=2779360 RepID=UPI001CA814F1|nr:FixH family protein [Marixanthomonas sp. SCSIO 43207]UAB80980.1 FixH family protein [Marixanthomonas sp. SCSIO 43207]
MKINWGTGILIGIIAFICFIMFFVIKMSTNDKYSYDLVVEEYYKKELAYQEEIDAEKNLSIFSENINGVKTKDGWQITFPSEIDSKQITGEVFLYRPSNKKLDFQFPLKISGSNLLIPDKSLLDGRWNITIDWQYKGKKYLYKDQILY